MDESLNRLAVGKIMRVHSLLLIGIIEGLDCFDRVTEKFGCAITAAPDADTALRLLSSGRTFDLVVMQGSVLLNEELLREIQAAVAGTYVAALYEPAHEKLLPRLLENGVGEVLSLPLSESGVETLFAKAARFLALARENQYCRVREIGPDDEFVGRAESTRQLLRTVDQVAASAAALWLKGPPGAGKKLLARIIHRRSARNQGPFIYVSCADFPETLLETELFAPGAGRYELAERGTLVLDRLEHMSASVQQRLAQALKEEAGAGAGAGAGRRNAVSARVICVTNSVAGPGAQGQVQGQALDPELSRLLTTVHLPPLHERGEDVILLAEYFMRCYSHALLQPAAALSLSAREALLSYRWPGNVQELKYCIERAVLLAGGGQITAEILGLTQGARGSGLEPGLAAKRTAAARQDDEGDGEALAALPDDALPQVQPGAAALAAAGAAADLSVVSVRVGQPLADVKREMITRTLDLARGNRTKAANILGISVRTLYTKLLEIERLKKK